MGRVMGSVEGKVSDGIRGEGVGGGGGGGGGGVVWNGWGCWVEKDQEMILWNSNRMELETDGRTLSYLPIQ